MAKYRTYVEVDAVQWKGNNVDEVREFVGLTSTEDGARSKIWVKSVSKLTTFRIELFIERIKGWAPLQVDDWVVKDANGMIERYHPIDFVGIFQSAK